MKICVIGTGYVGLVAGACLAEMGHLVTCVDSDAAKVSALRNGIVTIHEPGLPELVSRNLAGGRLDFVDDLAATERGTRLYFISVGTPSNADGSPDLSQVMSAARDVGCVLRDRAVVIVRSTVPVGATERVEEAILEQLHGRGVCTPVDVAFNPEFLREGRVLHDIMHPRDRQPLRHPRRVLRRATLHVPCQLPIVPPDPPHHLMHAELELMILQPVCLAQQRIQHRRFVYM